jgi:hypothetical protein
MVSEAEPIDFLLVFVILFHYGKAIILESETDLIQQFFLGLRRF